VADELTTTAPPRARSVSELPGQSPASPDELAKRWVLALIRERPLAAIADVPFQAFAALAPDICSRTIGAVRSDDELQALLTDPSTGDAPSRAYARRLADLCGAPDAGEVVRAVEALRGVLWEALAGQLAGAPQRLLAEVGDRLAYVCSAALAVAVDTPSGSADTGSWQHASRVAVREHAALAVGAWSASSAPATIVDEFAVDTVAGEAATSPQPLPREEQIEIRDQRGDGGPAAWIGSIGAQLQRFDRDAQPFAVLLVELAEIERLRRDRPAALLARAGERMELALAAQLEPATASITRERPGRCWLVVPHTDRAAALSLAERLAGAVASAGADHRKPAPVAIGTAVCPEDGRNAAALAAHADVGLYAARANLRAAGPLRPTPVDEAE
jgi:GGDEF domain-containing protein